MLGHIYGGPEDGRKTLTQVEQCVAEAAAAHLSGAGGAARPRAPAPGTSNDAGPLRPASGGSGIAAGTASGSERGFGADSAAILATLTQRGPALQTAWGGAQWPPAAASLGGGGGVIARAITTAAVNPRGAVAAWFAALAARLAPDPRVAPAGGGGGKGGRALKDLLQACDTDRDGFLEQVWFCYCVAFICTAEHAG